MNKPILIIAVCGLLVFGFVMGVATGAMAFKKRDPLAGKGTELIKVLSSKTATAISFSGKAVSISGNEITISAGSDEVKIAVKSGAPVYSFIQDKDGKMIQNNIKLADVKPESSVNISAKVMPDGNLEAQAISMITLNFNEKGLKDLK